MNSDFRADSTGTYSLAERGRLLLALYQGALGFLEHAVAAHGRENFDRFAYFLERARNVIAELASTLDYEQGRELATMLSRLYEFMSFQLSEAARTRNVEVVREEMNRLRQIYDSYRQVVAGVDAQTMSAPTGSGIPVDEDTEDQGVRAEKTHGAP